MKKIYILAIIIVSLLTPIVLYAANSPAQTESNQLEFNFMMYYLSYAEELPAPFKSTESGALIGGNAAFVNDKPSNFHFFRVSVEYTNGTTTYVGTTQTGIPVTGTTGDVFFDSEMNIGLKFSNEPVIAPYIGIGFRYWYRLLGKDTAAAYSEGYSWFYFPVGVLMRMVSFKDLEFTLDASVRYMFGGYISINIPGLDPASTPLGGKIGGKIRAPIRYELFKGFSLIATPWVEYSAIGQSNIFTLTYGGRAIASAYEPSSSTYQFGLNLGVRIDL